jgi:hypothetical protein
MRAIPGHGLVFDGHDTPRTELLAAARKYLLEQGAHELDADDQLADRPGLVVRAWWGRDETGFVQEHHDGAQAVTVVHCGIPS